MERTSIAKKNYEYFKKELKNIIEEHKNEYALIVNQEIKNYFKTLEEAVNFGRANFLNENGEYNFSVQEVTEDKDHLGFISNVLI